MVTFLEGGQDEAKFSLRDYPVARAALQRALEQFWELMAKTIFVLRHVFHEDCIFPDTLRKANMMLVEIHGLAEWDPSAKGALDLDVDAGRDLPGKGRGPWPGSRPSRRTSHRQRPICH